MYLPHMYQIRQNYDLTAITDLAGEVRRSLDSIDLAESIRPGSRIGITCGSRGIANIAVLTRAVCDYVRCLGAVPFLIPSMGSHGGATAKGQKKVLAHYGITEETMDCEICSSMETVCLGATPGGCPVHMDRTAREADGIIVVNRVKPHTDFIAENESGIVKMVSIGLGNKTGATAVHKYGLAESIPQVFTAAARQMPFLAGLAILENAREETCLLQAVRPGDFLKEDARLLKTAYSLVPSLPGKDIDILVVKEMGKCYSGTGMDTKVIGRIRIDGIPEPVSPHVKKLAVLRLADSSDGNALGIGLADITTRELVDSIDYDMTYTNLIHTTFLERGKIPVTAPTEQAAVEMAFCTIGAVPPEEAKVMIIDNTLHIDTLWVSGPLLECLDPERYTVLQEKDLAFSADGRMEEL